MNLKRNQAELLNISSKHKNRGSNSNSSKHEEQGYKTKRITNISNTFTNTTPFTSIIIITDGTGFTQALSNPNNIYLIVNDITITTNPGPTTVYSNLAFIGVQSSTPVIPCDDGVYVGISNNLQTITFIKGCKYSSEYTYYKTCKRVLYTSITGSGLFFGLTNSLLGYLRIVNRGAIVFSGATACGSLCGTLMGSLVYRVDVFVNAISSNFQILLGGFVGNVMGGSMVVGCKLRGEGDGSLNLNIIGGTVGGLNAAGGFVGTVDVSSTVVDCEAIFYGYASAVIGINPQDQDFTPLNVSVDSGGFCGKNYGVVEKCCVNFCKITNLVLGYTDSPGAIEGATGGPVYITDCVGTSLGSGIGGFCGTNFGMISRCDVAIEHTVSVIVGVTIIIRFNSLEAFLACFVGMGGIGGFCGYTEGQGIRGCSVKMCGNEDVIVGFDSVIGVDITVPSTYGIDISNVGLTSAISGVIGGVGGFFGVNLGEPEIVGCEGIYKENGKVLIGSYVNTSFVGGVSVINGVGVNKFTDVFVGVGGFGGTAEMSGGGKKMEFSRVVFEGNRDVGIGAVTMVGMINGSNNVIGCVGSRGIDGTVTNDGAGVKDPMGVGGIGGFMGIVVEDGSASICGCGEFRKNGNVMVGSKVEISSMNLMDATNVVSCVGSLIPGEGSGVGGFCGYVANGGSSGGGNISGVEVFEGNCDVGIGASWNNSVGRGEGGVVLNGGIGGVCGYVSGPVCFDVKRCIDCGAIVYKSFVPTLTHIGKCVGYQQ